MNSNRASGRNVFIEFSPAPGEKQLNSLTCCMLHFQHLVDFKHNCMDQTLP